MSLSGVLCMLLAIVGVLMMFVILLQRGRGGGLAGAFGGLGGQSAFGTKAGDVFTRITIAMAVVWVALAAGAGFAMRWESKGRFQGAKEAVSDTATMGAVADGKADQKGEEPVGKGQKEPGFDKVLDLPGSEAKSESSAGKADGKKPESEAAKNTPVESKPAESKPAEAPKKGASGQDAPKADEKK